MLGMRSASAGLRIAGVDRPLSGERSAVCRPRLAAGDRGRDQAERMQRRCAGSRFARNETRRTSLGWPTSSSAQRTRVARQAHAAIGRPLEGGDDDGHRETLPAAPSRDRNSEAAPRIGRSPRLDGQGHMHRDSAHLEDSLPAARPPPGHFTERLAIRPTERRRGVSPGAQYCTGIGHRKVRHSARR